MRNDQDAGTDRLDINRRADATDERIMLGTENEDACSSMTVLISTYAEPILVTLTLSCCSSAVEVEP